MQATQTRYTRAIHAICTRSIMRYARIMHALYTRYMYAMCTRYTRGAVLTGERPDLTLQRPLFVPIFFCAVPCAFYAVAAAAGGGSIDLARLQDDGYVACCIAQLSARQDKKRRACATVRIAFMGLIAPAAHAALALGERTTPSDGLPPCATAETGAAGGAAMLILSVAAGCCGRRRRGTSIAFGPTLTSI